MTTVPFHIFPPMLFLSIVILVNNAFKTVQQRAKDKEDICRRADAGFQLLFTPFTVTDFTL